MSSNNGEIGSWSRPYQREEARGPSGPGLGLGTKKKGKIFCFFPFFLSDHPLGDVSSGPVPPPPLEWLSFPPLAAAMLITPKGAESPGSGRIGVIGALVFFPSEAV